MPWKSFCHPSVVTPSKEDTCVRYCPFRFLRTIRGNAACAATAGCRPSATFLTPQRFIDHAVIVVFASVVILVQIIIDAVGFFG